MPSLIPEKLTDPGTHVLVIGVSAYRHFDDGPDPTHAGELLGMGQLGSAARSASEFAAWMLQEYTNQAKPLSSLRVLLSPSDGEAVQPDIDALGPSPATLANVTAELIAFRATCDTSTDNVAVVFVAGHGVQLTNTGAIVLLHDCGGAGLPGLLSGAIDVAGVHDAFDHPGTAQTQFWFVDACRQKPGVARRFETLAGALVLDQPGGAARSTPMFLSASTGEQAFARVGGISLFTEALLGGLRGGIAQTPDPGISQRWHVSVLELVRRLRGRVEALAVVEGVEQSVDPAGRLNEALFHEYGAPPDVDVTVSLQPEAATHGSAGSLRHGKLGFVLENATEWPMQGRFVAGFYELSIKPAAGFQRFSDFISVRPPAAHEDVELTS